MLGSLERPDVDKISGLSPVIAIEQKTINRNPGFGPGRLFYPPGVVEVFFSEPVGRFRHCLSFRDFYLIARISTELDAQLADSSFDLYLVEETSRYVYRIFAAKTLMENPAKYGFNLLADQFYTPEAYTETTVTSCRSTR